MGDDCTRKERERKREKERERERERKRERQQPQPTIWANPWLQEGWTDRKHSFDVFGLKCL
jgi:hypothetical protein